MKTMRATMNMKNLFYPVFLMMASPLVFSAAEVAEPLVKITKERIPMDEKLRLLCRGPEMVIGPHGVAEVDIHVNQIVLDYRKANPDKFTYPIGSKFVKVKYSDIGNKEPDLATIMVKTGEKGDVTDWVFTMETLPDHKPVVPAGKTSCATCHDHFQERGFISSQSENALREFLKTLVDPEE